MSINIIKQLQDAEGNNIYPIAFNNGGVKMDLLWSNPNPTINFGETTIDANQSGYDLIMIIYIQSLNNPGRNLTTFAKPGYGHCCQFVTSNATYRNSTATLTTISFLQCIRNTFSTSPTTTNPNDALIPIYVYGIKTSWVVPTSVQGLQYVEV